MSRRRGLTRSLLLTACALLAVSLPLAADHAPLPEFEAEYTLSLNGLDVAELQVRLHREGEHYMYESFTRPIGVLALFRDDRIRETSQWVYGREGRIQPLRYTYQHTGSKREREADLRFDWAAGKVLNRVENEPWTMEIPQGTQDKLGYQLALMLDLSHGRRDLSYHVADGGKLKVYQVDFQGMETLQTELGELRTIKVQRQKDRKGRVTTIWCAEKLAYLPVRITHRDADGSFFTLRVTAVNGIPAG